MLEQRAYGGVQIVVCSIANIVCLQQRNLERKLDPFILSPCDFRNHCDGPEHPDFLGFIWKSEVECRDELDQGSLHLNQPVKTSVVQSRAILREKQPYASLQPMQFLTPAENDSLGVPVSKPDLNRFHAKIHTGLHRHQSGHRIYLFLPTTGRG